MDRPIRQCRVAAAGVVDGPMRANCPNMAVHEMGQRGCLGICIFQALLANANSSARVMRSYRGPMRAYRPNLMVHGMDPYGCSRAHASEFSECWGPTPTHWQRQRIGVTGQCDQVVEGSNPPNSKLDRPIQQYRPAATAIADGPMRVNCANMDDS